MKVGKKLLITNRLILISIIIFFFIGAGILANVNHAQGIKAAIDGELLGEKPTSHYYNNP